MMRRALALLACAMAMPAAAATKAALPPYSGAYQPQGVDEKGLWHELDEQERVLRDSKFVIDDPMLNGYVRRVLCQTVGDDRCQAVRIYLMREADFNASMAPNGAMLVNSGLLLRLRNEAELAGVLAHEFAHFEQRHSLEGFKRARKTTDILAWTALMGVGGNMATLLIGSFYSFTRDQEKEADIEGAKYLAASPYRVASMSDTWETLLAEYDATAVARKQRSRRNRGTSFFDTHPAPANRRDYLARIAAATPGGGETRTAGYRTAVTPWLPRLIDDQIARNDFGGTDYILGQRADGVWTNDLLFARAELYRRRGNPRDLSAAAAMYSTVLQGQADRAEAWRGLGLVLMRGGDAAGGKAALQHYLNARPDALDSGMIKAMVQS